MKTSTLALVVALAFAPGAQAVTLYSCPTGGGGDQLDRGFYVTNYPGITLDTVTLTYYAGSGDGTYTFALTPHLSTYDGAVIGTTQQQTVTLTGATGTAVTFHFANSAVPAGSTVAFTQSVVSGPGAAPYAFYDTGTDTPACPNVFETGDTAPPLGTPPIRRNTIGVTIAGAPPLPPPPLPQTAVSAPAMGVPGFVLMIGALLGLALARVKSRAESMQD
jgi:hypothetical protein